MKKNTELINIGHPDAISRAAEVINKNGVIAFPTDTVYGIGVSAFSETAINKIYEIKGRSQLKALPILIGDIKHLDQVTPPLTPTARKISSAFWPGALTLILPLLPGVPGNISPTPTIGIRIPDLDPVRELLRVTGPLASTSANLSGEPSAQTASEVALNLGGRVDLILDGGKTQGGRASTVLDCSGDELAILREGPISLEDILQVLNDKA